MDWTAIILAAGKGTRMKSNLPKPMHKVAGKPILDWIINACIDAGAQQIIVVISKDSPIIKMVKNPKIEFIQQIEQLGTADAVKTALPIVKNDKVIILPGDAPLIKSETLKKLANQNENASLVSYLKNPTGYGRVVTDLNQNVIQKIIEEKDATNKEKEIKLINAGIYTFNKNDLEKIEGLNNNNAGLEFYLTDLAPGTKIIQVDNQEILGINSKIQLAEVNHMKQEEIQKKLMEQGVEILDPNSTYIEAGVEIGAGTVIKPFTMIEGPSKLGQNNQIGPSSHIRPNTITGNNVRIGNFVETKNVEIGENTQIGHLSYIGDAEIGQDVNIGAATIFVNYDGKDKHKTIVGDRAFIGSNTKLIAPLKLANETITAAGSTITNDIPEHAMGIARAKQTNKENFWKKMPHKFD